MPVLDQGGGGDGPRGHMPPSHEEDMSDIYFFAHYKYGYGLVEFEVFLDVFGWFGVFQWTARWLW